MAHCIFCILSLISSFATKAEFLSLKISLVFANGVDLDEMQHYAAFHLCLPCLPKDPLRDFKYTKG